MRALASTKRLVGLLVLLVNLGDDVHASRFLLLVAGLAELVREALAHLERRRVAAHGLHGLALLLLEAQALVDGQRLVPRRRRVLRRGLGHEAEALRLEQLVPQAPGEGQRLLRQGQRLAAHRQLGLRQGAQHLQLPHPVTHLPRELQSFSTTEDAIIRAVLTHMRQGNGVDCRRLALDMANLLEGLQRLVGRLQRPKGVLPQTRRGHCPQRAALPFQEVQLTEGGQGLLGVLQGVLKLWVLHLELRKGRLHQRRGLLPRVGDLLWRLRGRLQSRLVFWLAAAEVGHRDRGKLLRPGEAQLLGAVQSLLQRFGRLAPGLAGHRLRQVSGLGPGPSGAASSPRRQQRRRLAPRGAQAAQRLQEVRA
mmetsp:Transcript_98896/g.235912  ORF Transcript_98896/g.235912 Transcript_98896/m.235912 type:complete len:365 (+) Transcript_98896:1606-2700(+)